MTTKILVVDDEPAIGKLLTYQLQGFGYEVVYLADGLVALEQLPRENPDLVLLDVMMPTISGWDVCQQIRSCSGVPIIMLTAKSADSDVVTGLTAGADDYIAKPFSMAQLHARIEAVLRRTQPVSRPRAPGQTPLAPAPARPAAFAMPQPAIPPATVTLAPVELAKPMRLGPRLREERLARGLTLNQIERESRIRWEFLQAVEQDNYDYVPRAQLQGVLARYAAYLGLNLKDWGEQAIQQRKTQALQYATILTFMLLVIAVGLYLM